jgi:hypothetical protein
MLPGNSLIWRAARILMFCGLLARFGMWPAGFADYLKVGRKGFWLSSDVVLWCRTTARRPKFFRHFQDV